MINKILSVAILFLGLFTFQNSAFAQNVGVTVAVANETISGSDYEFDIYLRATANGPLYLGTSDFILTFDDTKFTSPAITAVTPATTYCSFVPIVSAQAAQCQNNYYNELAQSLDGDEIRINLNLPFEPTTTTEFDENIAKIDATPLTHRLGRFQISGANTTDLSAIALAWKTGGDGVVSQVFHFNHTGNFLLEPTIETFDIEPLSCAATWDGDAGDGLWATAANWSGDVSPASCSDVVIDNGDDVSLAGLTTTIKSLEIKNGSSLTVAVDGDLTVDGADGYGIFLGLGTDDLVNNGTISVTNSGDDGVYNNGDINNNVGGVFNITNAGDFGFYNNIADDLVNDGVFIIDNSADDGIFNKGTVLNNVGGQMTISNAGDMGFNNSTSKNLINHGTFLISDAANDGIVNNGTITNNSGGTLTVEDPIDFGIINRGNDKIYNYGVLNVTGSGDDGVSNDGTIINYSSGQFIISNVGDFGILNNQGDNFTNEGVCTITASVDDGIFNNGTITNNAGAQLIINNAGDYGIKIAANDVVNNAGTLTIANSADDAIYNGGTITNQSAGDVVITGAGDYGIFVGSGKIIDNSGDITITNSIDDGIINNGIVTNNSSGEITIIGSGSYGFLNRNGDQLNNAGILTISGSAAQALNNAGTVTNTGTLAGKGIFRTNNNDLDGTVAPGDTPGKMEFLTSQIFTGTNALEIDITGTTPEVDHDVVDVASIATISGRLAPIFDAGYTPSSGDRIVFLTANNISGTFATISPALPMGWSIDYSVSGEVALEYSTLKPVFSNPAVAEYEKSVEERISDDLKIYDLLVYPNPIKSGEVLNIKLDENESASSLVLYNQFGQLMKLWEFEGEQSLLSVKLPNVSSGMYLLKINSGEKSTTKRLLID